MPVDPKHSQPEITTDLPAAPSESAPAPAATPGVAGPDTARRNETSVSPQAPSVTGAFVPESFDPARTGEHTPTSLQDGQFSTDFPLKPNPLRVPKVAGYEIVGELGRGGMGVVYKAVQEGLGRHVALKMILAGAHASSQTIARFVAEAQAVARFQHANIVQVFEVGEHQGLPYFSLEYVDGGTLQKKVAREPQPPRYAAEIVEQLARAMQYSHDRGIIHRDLKPANILLAIDGTPKITDFGLAKVLEEDSGNTQSGQVLGTPSYMAPEQARGDTDAIGKPADVYALGAILYDLLTGRPPFAGSSVLDTLEMVRSREPVSPSELTGTLPRDIETICLKCLQKDAAKRYASAAELADDLRRFLEGRPILARPISRAERTWRWAKRNPVGAVAVLLGVAVLVVPSILSVLLFVAEGKATESANRANVEKGKAEVERDDKEKARAAEEVAKLKAIDEEKRAVAARDLARQRLGIAIDTARGGLLTIDDLMRNRLSLAPLRLTIIKAILKDLDKIRETANQEPLLDRNEAIGYSRIADIYLRSGQIQDAVLWYRKAYEVSQRLWKLTPHDAVALRNFAAIGNMLAEVEWRSGDGAKARTLYADALKHRQERLKIVEPLKKVDATYACNLDIATSHGLLAFTELRLGNLASALENYLASDKMYESLPTRGTVEVRFARSEIQVRLGDAKLRLGKFDDALKHYQAALAAREALLKEASNSPALKGEVGHARLYLGDYFLATGDPSRAAREYAQVLREFEVMAKADPENLAYQQRLAAVQYRLGVVSAKQSASAAVMGWAAETAASADHFEKSLDIRTQLARIDSSDAQSKLELMLSLGRMGRAEDAEKLARELLELKNVDAALKFQAACGLAVAAGGSPMSNVAERCKTRSFEVLNGLIDGGWKVPGLLETEPDLDSLRGDPRFGELIKSPRAGRLKS